MAQITPTVEMAAALRSARTAVVDAPIPGAVDAPGAVVVAAVLTAALEAVVAGMALAGCKDCFTVKAADAWRRVRTRRTQTAA